MSGKHFIKLVIVGWLLLPASVNVVAQQKSAGWLNGNWEGVGYQLDDQSTWAMKLTARRGRYSIDYPSLNCGGRWRLVSINGARAQFREILNRGQDKCADRGKVFLQRLNRNQIVFLYSYAGVKDISASAVLNKKP